METFNIVKFNENLTAIENSLSNYNLIFDSNFSINDVDYNFLQNIQVITKLPREILSNLYLNDYSAMTMDNFDFELLSESLKFLDNYSLWKNKYNYYLKSICYLDTINDNSKGRKITSLTMPTFPFCSFISSNAFIHLPPEIFKPKSFLPISENILHESVHQFVSISILENNIFKDDFVSKNSPKIDIPWRKNDSEARNRSWELDRCIHAFFVYSEVFKFRLFVHNSIDRSYFSKDEIESARANKNYIGSQLISFRELFTDYTISKIESNINE